MEQTIITIKVKKKKLEDMTINEGKIQGANEIVRALASVSEDRASFEDAVSEIVAFGKLVEKNRKKVNRIDEQLEKHRQRELREIAKLEAIQLRIEKLKQQKKAKLSRRDQLCDEVKNNGYYSRKAKGGEING